MFIKNISKIYRITNKEENKFLFLCFLLMIINALFELLSVGILIPLISFFFNSASSTYSYIPFFQSIRSFFEIFTFNQLLIFILFIFLLKNIFITFYNFFVGNIVLKIRTRLVEDLYNKYLFQDFQFFLKKNSSEIIRNINEAQNFSMIIISYLVIFLEVLIFLTFSIFLLLSKPKLVIIIFSILIISIFILSITFKKKLFKFGYLRQIYEKNIKKIIIDNFSNIKLIKISNTENQFSKIFSRLDYSLGKIQFKSDIILQIPRAAIEMIVLISICTLIFISYSSTPALEIITFLGVLFASILRLMPSATRIIAALQRLKFYEPLINLIATESKLKIKNNLLEKKSLKNFQQLIFDNVSFKYSNNYYIYKNINLTIHRNKIYCFIGENGVGKSTLIHLMTGILRPSGGKIIYNNKNINDVLPSIGYVSQNINLIDDTIKNNIIFPNFQKKLDSKKFKKSIYFSNLNEFVRTAPNGINTLVGESGSQISGGQSQKISLARALYSDPEILILDEFDNNLDQNSEMGIISKLNKLKKNKTIILISHNKEIFKICDEIYKISNKKITKI
jgi:ABC-type bacteriocin/lantibiotic exporter with double-glycine peptidase domain